MEDEDEEGVLQRHTLQHKVHVPVIVFDSLQLI